MMFSCMDSRVVPTKYTNADLGDNYIVKNSGNFIPYPDDLHNIANTTSAAGALELTCVRNNVRHVIVAGHSDCKVCTTKQLPFRNTIKKACDLYLVRASQNI